MQWTVLWTMHWCNPQKFIGNVCCEQCILWWSIEILQQCAHWSMVWTMYCHNPKKFIDNVYIDNNVGKYEIYLTGRKESLQFRNGDYMLMYIGHQALSSCKFNSVHVHLTTDRNQTHNLSGIDCICSCKSNYHAIGTRWKTVQGICSWLIDLFDRCLTPTLAEFQLYCFVDKISAVECMLGT